MELHKIIRGEMDINSIDDALCDKPELCPFTLIAATATFKQMKSNESSKNANPLMVAVDLGNLALVKYLIEEGADVNAGRIDGSGPLHWALNKGHYKVARFLIKKGADVISPNDRGVAPIFYAINHSSPVSIVQKLIAKGVSADGILCTNGYFEPNRPILAAIAENNIPVVKFLLQKSVKVNFPLILDENVSALTFAVITNSHESVKLLIDYGAKIDGQDDEFPTPLMAAVNANRITSLKVLITAGADIHKVSILKKNIRTKMGTDEPDLTALHAAAILEHWQAAEELLKAGADVNKITLETKRTPLCIVCAHQTSQDKNDQSQLKMVKLLLENGADMYKIDKYNRSPMFYCLMLENYTIVKEFIHASFDVNSVIPRLGFSLLMHLAERGEWNMVKLCLEYGGNSAKGVKRLFGVKGLFSITPYERALKQGFDIIKLFFPYHPVDGYSAKRFKVPALINQFKYFDAIKKNNEEGVKLALLSGAEPRAFLTDLPLPIFQPVVFKNGAMLRILLEHGLCPNVQNSKLETPLHIAAQKGFLDGCHLLLQNGASYNVRSCAGHSPLKAAQISCASRKVVRLLKSITVTFRDAKKGKVAKIKDMLTNMPDAVFFTYINCANRKGNSLMQEAILSANVELAEFIMAQRLSRGSQES